MNTTGSSVLKEAQRISKIGKRDERPVVVPVGLLQSELYTDKMNRIPEKLHFKIGEVADFLGLKQYVLRYWETEFEELRPKKGSNNQRMYTRKNIELSVLIQHLLHTEKFSIEGARQFLKKQKEQGKNQAIQAAASQGIQKELISLQSEVYKLKLKLDSYLKVDQ
ncbi:MAG: MerR family transcriptional regulator [Bdellovibrionales bacterium]